MTSITELLEEHDFICGTARNIAEQRGSQYADEIDTLSTFKRASYLVGNTPALLCLDLIGVKVSRLANQIMKDPLGNLDTTYDLINYLIYLRVLLKEEN